MNRFLHFIQYHNAIPLAVTIVVMGASATFAATDPQAIYSASQQTVAIDNTYIVGKDLSTYSPQVQITGVTEDSDNYYVAYNFSTIDLVNSVWKDTVKPETMTVSKADLGPYRDLGVYVTQQLKQNVDRELARLKDTQEIERKNVSQKVVATTYGGLVGKFLNSSTETLPGYTPVVAGPPDTSQDQVASAGAADDSSSGGSNSGGAFPVVSSSSGNSSLRIQLLGNNPAQIPLRAVYVDLGGVVTDAANDNIGIHTFLNGTEVQQIQINTSTTSVSTITYKAADPQGNSVSVTRTVYVYDPAVGQPVPDSQVQHAGSAPPPQQPDTSTPVATSTPPAATSTPPVATSTPPAATTTPDTTSPAATTTPDTSASTTAPADTSTSTTPDTTTPPDTSASTTPPDSGTDASSTPSTGGN